MQQRPRVSLPQFQLYLMSEPSALPVLRLGLVVPKRQVRRAVGRNLIKRWARVLVREHADTLLALNPGHSVDLLVRIRAPLPTDRAHRRASFDILRAGFSRLVR